LAGWWLLHTPVQQWTAAGRGRLWGVRAVGAELLGEICFSLWDFVPISDREVFPPCTGEGEVSS